MFVTLHLVEQLDLVTSRWKLRNTNELHTEEAERSQLLSTDSAHSYISEACAHLITAHKCPCLRQLLSQMK